MKIVTRIVLGYAALAMAAGLAVTFSRGGWMAAAAGIVLLLVILLGHRNHRWKAILLLVVMLAGGGFLVSHYLSKTVGFMRRVASPDPKPVWWWLMQAWIRGWKCGARRRGCGRIIRGLAWGRRILTIASANIGRRQFRPRPDRVHNDYLNLLADWGAVGGVIVFAGMAIFVYSAKENLAARPARGK